MKPYQLDRALLHLRQAGKFEGVRGIILESSRSAKCRKWVDHLFAMFARRSAAMGVPIVFGFRSATPHALRSPCR
jgi:muramoyltetrapeptide carboxypeptidase LdcA involved in peptidoglycan recycling